MTTARRTELPSAADRAALLLAADILAQLPAALAGTRTARGLSQAAAARELGVNRQTFGRWETGTYHPEGAVMGAVLRWLAQPTGKGGRP